ncbi:hypothetical protein EVJ58_g9615 [Rhodofomes roseus]|uniref:amidase n=1 Tax=Rhodofomes roseus TaxID=34475 RepID=A0A4Y9XX35_9APHY|nr:hypothetical protein EVJ58_g9615 [Rhodofomes roseus]
MSSWQDLCNARKRAQVAALPKHWLIDLPPDDVRDVRAVPRHLAALLSPRELDITDTTDVDRLLLNLRTAVWSAVEVTTAFYKRAVVAQQLTNCLTEIFIDRALARAKEVDDYLKATGRPVGPLHGLPISLKDQFPLKGLETIMGYAGWIGRYADADCVLVEILHEQGAVPFVRTNVPQTLMWGETYNHVFGRTTHPFNRAMTPGGSSGGEGALIALRGSPLGVGTDIGGSVRIPSAFCGLYGLRPSYARLPYANAVNSAEGQESIASVLGPMAGSLAGVRVFTQAIVDAQPWRRDPARRAQGVAVGRPHPPVRRAMEIVKAALEKAGHTVIDWENHRHLELYEVAERVFAADDAHDFLTECARSGEPLIQTMSPETDAHEYALDEPFARTIVGERRHLSVYELWQLHKQKRDLRKSHLDHWEATVARTRTGRPVDAIISPVAPYTACPHGCNSYVVPFGAARFAFTDAFYTTMTNTLDYTTSVFPVTCADAELDKAEPPHAFYNHEDEAVYKLYDPQLFHGLPVGLQLIGRTLEEEGVIAMTEVVDKALKAMH